MIIIEKVEKVKKKADKAFNIKLENKKKLLILYLNINFLAL